MIKYLKKEAKRAIFRKQSIFIILSMCIIFAIEYNATLGLKDYKVNPNAANLITNMICWSLILYLVAPVLCSLPYANSYLEDLENNYFDYLILRLGKKKYFILKFLLNGVIGGLVLGGTTLIAYLFFTIIFIKNKVIPIINFKNEISMPSGVFEYYSLHKPITFVFITIYVLFVFGFIFSTIGLIASMYIKKKFVSILFPICFMVAFELTATSVLPDHYISPSALFYPQRFTNGKTEIFLLVQFLWIVALVIIYTIGVYRNENK